jgi:two-component system sensor histidine kinase RegB
MANIEDRWRLDHADSRLRLQTIVRLRWFAVLGQLAAIGVVYLILDFDLPVGWCLSFVALSAWVNVYLRVRYPVRYRLSARFATGLLAYDLVQLATLLYLTGGIENPFSFLLVAPVTVSAATLPPRHTIFLGALSAAAAALLVSQHLPLPWADRESLVLPPTYRVGMLASVWAGMLFMALYAWRLSKESRQMSAALAATEAVLAREQKLHALDGLAAAAAHELGTPLATITLVTKELEREVPAGSPLADDIGLLRSQALRCREILQQLTRRPSEQDPMHDRLTVRELLDEAAAPYRRRGKEIAIAAAARTNGAGVPSAEPVGQRRPGLIHGVANLVQNAVEFAATRVEVSAEWDEREVLVTIADDGPGFPPEVMDSLGEPYVTTRPLDKAGAAAGASSGLGLGFFIAKTLLERSGATLALANRRQGGGAMVRLTWPRAQFEAEGVEEDMALPVGSGPAQRRPTGISGNHEAV